MGNEEGVIGGNLGQIALNGNQEINFTWPYISMQLNNVTNIENV